MVLKKTLVIDFNPAHHSCMLQVHFKWECRTFTFQYHQKRTQNLKLPPHSFKFRCKISKLYFGLWIFATTDLGHCYERDIKNTAFLLEDFIL